VSCQVEIYFVLFRTDLVPITVWCFFCRV